MTAMQKFVYLKLVKTDNLTTVAVKTNRNRLIAQFYGRTRPEAKRMARRFILSMSKDSARTGLKAKILRMPA